MIEIATRLKLPFHKLSIQRCQHGSRSVVYCFRRREEGEKGGENSLRDVLAWGSRLVLAW
jgi:hypothetical protein